MEVIRCRSNSNNTLQTGVPILQLQHYVGVPIIQRRSRRPLLPSAHQTPPQCEFSNNSNPRIFLKVTPHGF